MIDLILVAIEMFSLTHRPHHSLWSDDRRLGTSL